MNLAALEKQLGGLRAKRAAQEKRVAEYIKPLADLDDIKQQEAEAERAYLTTKERVAQWLAERADHRTWLRAVDKELPHIHGMMEHGNALVQACGTSLQAIDIGLDPTFFGLPKYRLQPVLDEHAHRTALVAELEKQIVAHGGTL